MKTKKKLKKIKYAPIMARLFSYPSLQTGWGGPPNFWKVSFKKKKTWGDVGSATAMIGMVREIWTIARVEQNDDDEKSFG